MRPLDVFMKPALAAIVGWAHESRDLVDFPDMFLSLTVLKRILRATAL
jgi:hypothetical protein